MEWSEIALPVGSPPSGFGLHLNFTLPPSMSSVPASERQSEAVKFFYETDFGDLTDCQAHVLISCREFARLCSETLFRRYPEMVRRTLSRGIAAFLLSDERTRKFVETWSDRNFNKGIGYPRVRGTPCFSEVQDFASYLDGMLHMNGWSLEDLKKLG